MSEPFIGQIVAAGFNYPPVGWAACNGQLLSISENELLFSLIGTTYGGDGTSTFAVPDLRGRSPVGFGQGSGLSPYVLAQNGGVETVTLIGGQLPVHSHGVTASSAPGTANAPASNLYPATQGPANPPPQVSAYAPYNAATQVPLAGGTIGLGGQVGPQPHANRQPYLALNYIIATEGVYPPRP